MRLFALLAPLLGLALAQDPPQELPEGTHSEIFDAQKYSLNPQLLLTPINHPDHFIFTGRWLHTPTSHPIGPAHHATLWPLVSVTILVHGPSATLKLRPLHQGYVGNYSFVASVDGGPDIRYNTDGFDTNAPSSSVQYISLTFPTAPATSLAPHTIRLTSLPVTPLSFEGVLIQNTQLSNSQLWSEAQRLRPYLEFIGEGFDGERPGGFFRDDDTWRSVAGAAREDPSDAPFSTTQYALGERLGIRHSHYVTNTCIASDCDTRKLPGLGKQYFHASPDDYLMRTPHVLEPADPRHHSNVHAAWRFSESNTPSHVIVDTGILDILHNKMSRDDYTHFLAVFLARLRSQAHPNATIMVVARKGPPNDDDTVFNSDFTTSSYRESLYSATLRAVEKLRDPRTVLVPVKLADVDLQTAYLRGLCPHLVGTGSKSVGRACANAMASQSLVGKRTVMTVLVLVLVVGMLWILRAKLLGALATVLGSKRLGMQEEEGLLNTAASASGGK